MAELDVLLFLEEQRKINKDWFRVCEIKEALKEKGVSDGALTRVNKQISKLALYGMIEFRGVGVWDHYKVFRGKI